MPTEEELVRDVCGCGLHPSCHLVCYVTGGTGIAHTCQHGGYTKRRNLGVCLERYEATLGLFYRLEEVVGNGCGRVYTFSRLEWGDDFVFTRYDDGKPDEQLRQAQQNVEPCAVSGSP
jgi:hypothetical protein